MIQVEQLTKKFKDKIAVQQISFKVDEAEKLILLGTSGSGKTTTLKMLNRLIEPDEGKIWIQQENILNQNKIALRRKIGYVIQQFGLFPHYTVEKNIAVVPLLLQWNKKQTQTRTEELMNMLNLPYEEFAKRFPHELSGGQKQRVGIARALATNPPLLLLDEPLGALDTITRHQIQQELKKIWLHQTVVMVTHDLMEAIELGDKIALMHEGKIQQIGTPQSLFFQPYNDFVAQFFQPYQVQLNLRLRTLQEIFPLPFEDTFAAYNSTLSFQPTDNLWDVFQKLMVSTEEYVEIKNIVHQSLGLIQRKKMLQLLMI